MCYNTHKSYGETGTYTNYIYLSNGEISTELSINNSDNVPHEGEKALIFYKPNATFKTYKIK